MLLTQQQQQQQRQRQRRLLPLPLLWGGANKRVVGACRWCYGMTVMIWLRMDLWMH
jgi:hypothetical protein